MTKTIKVLAILFIALLFITNISLATDINMNLQPEDSNISNELEETTNDVIDEGENSILTTTPSTTISTLSSNSNETLSLTNILNILLIVVGVVLILLGIAILIRMHS